MGVDSSFVGLLAVGEAGATWEISAHYLQFCCEPETALKMVINLKTVNENIFFLFLSTGGIRLYNITFTVRETLTHTCTHQTNKHPISALFEGTWVVPVQQKIVLPVN